MDEKVLIAMSGGVDSSLAAALMKEEGFSCIGASMILYNRVEEDLRDASEAARFLDIPFLSFDFSERFREIVTDDFVNAYIHGRTPNPCIVCNRNVKFGLLLDRAADLGCSRLATGHYARVEYDPESGRYLLKKALDAGKDQSYFLCALTQDQLRHIRFPLGELKKTEVRQMARERGLPTAGRRESQDICFVENGKYAEFVESYVEGPLPAGDFVDRDQNVLGKHEGIIYYTIGQRKGLGLSLGEPAYVLGIHPEDNSVTLGPDEALFSDTLTADHLNLISTDRIDRPVRLKARIRSRQTEQWATVEQTGADTIRVVFDEPQRAITPGQAVVLYDGDIVTGGATIQS